MQYVEIDLAANETLDCCIDTGTASKECRRKSLRTHSQKQNEDGTCTPKNLIDDMTSFTFSNYFIPVSKENSPLPKLTWANNDEVWEIMLQKDRKYKRDPLYLRRHQSLQPRMRSILLDWLIEVSDYFHIVSVHNCDTLLECRCPIKCDLLLTLNIAHRYWELISH